jgi:hypothetical protein
LGVCSAPYSDKEKVVGVFVHFSLPLMERLTVIQGGILITQEKIIDRMETQRS